MVASKIVAGIFLVLLFSTVLRGANISAEGESIEEAAEFVEGYLSNSSILSQVASVEDCVLKIDSGLADYRRFLEIPLDRMDPSSIEVSDPAASSDPKQVDLGVIFIRARNNRRAITSLKTSYETGEKSVERLVVARFLIVSDPKGEKIVSRVADAIEFLVSQCGGKEEAY